MERVWNVPEVSSPDSLYVQHKNSKVVEDLVGGQGLMCPTFPEGIVVGGWGGGMLSLISPRMHAHTQGQQVEHENVNWIIKNPNLKKDQKENKKSKKIET